MKLNKNLIIIFIVVLTIVWISLIGLIMNASAIHLIINTSDFRLIAQTQSYVCDDGFVLEQVGNKYNCRNPICDAGFNFYGDAIDNKISVPVFMLNDKNGMPRPIVKDTTGKWVGWTIGAYQCPPDPIGLHPNPAWPCGFNYCPSDLQKPSAPKNLRKANRIVGKKDEKLDYRYINNFIGNDANIWNNSQRKSNSNNRI